jgi:hypothetical protein
MTNTVNSKSPETMPTTKDAIPKPECFLMSSLIVIILIEKILKESPKIYS